MSVAKYDAFNDLSLLLSHFRDMDDAIFVQDDVAAAITRITQNIFSLEPDSIKKIPLHFRSKIICNVLTSQMQQEMNQKEGSNKEDAANKENLIMKFLKSDPALARFLWQHENKIVDQTILQINKDCTELIFTNPLLSSEEVKVFFSRIDAATKAKITSINLSQCDIPDLEILKEFPNLLKLDISSNISIESLNGIENCKEIREIRMSKSGVRKLHELEHSSKLEILDASGCVSLKYIGALCRISTLKYLNLNSCPTIDDFTAIKSLVALERLEMKNMRKLINLDLVKNLVNLTHLYVDSSQVGDISGTVALKKLTVFSYTGTPAYAHKLKSQASGAAAKAPN